MIKNFINVLFSSHLPTHISYKIVINLLILKTLSKQKIKKHIDFKILWNSLVNISANEKKEYFVYSFLPSLQNNKELEPNLLLIFKNIHVAFLDIDNELLNKFIDLVDSFNTQDIQVFISNLNQEFKSGYIKTLDTEIQKNIIRILDIKSDDKVLDLNLIGSNFLSLLSNDSRNNIGFIQSHNELPIRFLELLLSDNTDVQLIINDPLYLYNSKFTNKFDTVFTIPPFGQRLRKEDYDYDFPIKSSISHNLYIQKALNSLKEDGKCAIVVPDIFLNQVNKETNAIRKHIFEKLVSIVNLGPVFKPYTGLNVSLIILKNDNYNNNILMVNFQDFKTFPIEDFTDFTERFVACKFNLDRINLDDTLNINLVSKEEIEDNNFILDFKRYQPLEEIVTPVKKPEELIKEIEEGTKLLLESISNIRKIRNSFAHSQIHLEAFELEQIASIRLGKPLPKDNIENGEIPYVNISDITKCSKDYIDSSEVMISENFAYEKNLTIVKPNSILLSVRGTIGKVILTGSKIAISPTLVAIEVDTNRVNPYFIYQWFLNKKEYFEANAVGVTISSLSTAFIKELKIDLPAVKIQNKFEIYKNDLDNIKQTLSKLNDENQNLSKSIFNQFY